MLDSGAQLQVHFLDSAVPTTGPLLVDPSRSRAADDNQGCYIFHQSAIGRDERLLEFPRLRIQVSQIRHRQCTVPVERGEEDLPCC